MKIAVYGVCLLWFKSVPITCSWFPTRGGFCGQKCCQFGSSIWSGLVLILLNQLVFPPFCVFKSESWAIYCSVENRANFQEPDLPLNMLFFISRYINNFKYAIFNSEIEKFKVKLIKKATPSKSINSGVSPWVL